MSKKSKERRRFPWFSSLLGIVAIGSVVTLFNSGALNAGYGSFGTNLTAILERALSGTAQADESAPSTVTLRDTGLSDGMFISGFPSYGSITLPLIRDTDKRAVRLVLAGTQDVSTGTVAALRVIVNGQRVLERVLVPGAREFRWVVDIPAGIWNDASLRVGFQLHGDLPNELCHNERSIGAVINLSPETGVEMDISGRVSSLRDVVALIPSDVTIAFSESADSNAFFSLASRLGARLTRQGYHVEFAPLSEVAALYNSGRGLILLGSDTEFSAGGFERIDDAEENQSATLWERDGYVHIGLTNPQESDLADFMTSDLLSIARSAFANPLRYEETHTSQHLTRFDELGADTSTHQVSDSFAWNMKYALSNLPDGRTPDNAVISIRLPEGPADFTNLVHTELNGLMIDSRHLQTGQVNTFMIDLPAQEHLVQNALKVSVQRHREEGGCAITARRYPIQLLEESGLMFDVDPAQATYGLSGLPYLFRDGVDLRVPGEMDAEERMELLALTSEILSAFLPNNIEPSITFVLPGGSNAVEGTTPFIALNHRPENVDARLIVDGNNVAIRDSQQVGAAEITDINNVAILEAVYARIPAPTRRNPNAYRTVSGMVAYALDTPPSILESGIGLSSVAVVHDNGVLLDLD
jgi:hypothetical protein